MTHRKRQIESNLPIYLLRGMKVSIEEAWVAGKNFIQGGRELACHR